VEFSFANLFRKGKFVGTFPMGFDLQVSSMLRQAIAGPFSCQDLHGLGSAFELFIGPFNDIGGAWPCLTPEG
jgi:hypothetical protein